MRTLKGQAVVRNESNPSDYPFDRILDAVPGVSAGTPGEEKTLGDLLQGFYEVLRRAGITPNEAPEKKDSSQFADAVEFLKPVAIIRAGYDVTTSAVGLLGGKFKTGYNATFVEFDTSGTTTIQCKLSVLKGGVACTEKLLVSVTPGYITPGIVSAIHGIESDGDDYYFDNASDWNIGYYNAAGSDIAVVRQEAHFLISVYKIEA